MSPPPPFSSFRVELRLPPELFYLTLVSGVFTNLRRCILVTVGHKQQNYAKIDALLRSPLFFCGVDSASKNEYQAKPGGKGGWCVRLTTYHFHVPMSRNLGALTSWNPVGMFRPIMGQLYLLPLACFSRRTLLHGVRKQAGRTLQNS
jgi:hypothetical protein